MVYGSDTWPMKVEDMQKLERMESMMMRWMSITKGKKTNSGVEESLGIDDVAAVIRYRRLTWFGHIEHKDPKDWVAACSEVRSDGSQR